MSIHAIAPSPLARLLLELESRAASGGIDAGGRRLVLLKGGLLEVRPAPDDGSLGEFLIAAGRLNEAELTQAQRLAAERRLALEAALRQLDLVPVDALNETRRALWLDRFVRGLAAEERTAKQPSLLSPEPHSIHGATTALLPFVLDGLTRRAAFGDAENVGRHADAWFEWLDTPQRERAAAWADLGDIDGPIQTASMFARHPAAPSRIAGLARAGLARLSEKRLSLPPAAPRTPSIAAPAPVPEGRPRGSIAPPPITPLPPVAPGAMRSEGSPLQLTAAASWFPQAKGTLDDPLDALERRIAALEQRGASEGERAQAWLELARGFMISFDSVDEAARANREAAAAATEDPKTVEAAAKSCSVVCRPELAYAYAKTWAELLAEPTKRAQALTFAAHCAVRANKDGSALRALQQASELATEDGRAAERYARALLAQGEIKQALVTARSAAKRYREATPRAARVVLAWASSVAPNDPDVASDYASCLAAEGYIEAAVAILSRGARRAESPEIARRLFRNAAVRAELSARPDLAAHVLLEAIDLVGSENLSASRSLLNSLAACGDVVEVAVLGAELAETAKDKARAELYARAADARLEMPGDSSYAIELYTKALCADPDQARAYHALQQVAETTHEIYPLSDALERAIAASEQDGTLSVLFERFFDTVRRAEQPMLMRKGIELAERLGISAPFSAQELEALTGREAHYENEARRLEQELRTASSEIRTQAALALANHLRCDPDRRSTAQKLYEKVLEADPAHADAHARLEALLRLQGDKTGLCVLASQRVQHARRDFAKITAMLSWVHAEYDNGNHAGAIEACLALLALAPKHREGVLLLSRLAHRLGDATLLRNALERRAAGSLDPRTRALVHCTLAQLCQTSDPNAALDHAESALRGDPRCAAAALLVLEQHFEFTLQRRLPLLRAARSVLGDNAELLQVLAQSQFEARDARGQLETLEAHAELSAFDSLPALALLTLLASGNDPDSILRALRIALDVDRFGEGTILLARGALDRLWVLGHRRQAIVTVLAAADELGENATPLVEWADSMVSQLLDPALERAVLERMVVRTSGPTRSDVLRKLATFHESQGARSAEARTYLRLLALEPSSSEVLDKLAYVYAETREFDRLMAVLTLRLELAATLTERRERLLSLACAAIEADDPAGAEDLIRAALADHPDQGEEREPSDDIVRRGLGLLLGSRSPQLAFDLLLAMSESAAPARACALLEEAVFIAETRLNNRDLALRAATLGLESHPHHITFLLHFERLALDLGDVATGREVYRHLADSAMGLHGRKAVMYRAGRWLERAGALSEALEALEKAFALTPSEGAMLAAIERLARAAGAPDALVRCLSLLAEHAPLARERRRIWLRAGCLCEEELRDYEQAVHCYEQALRSLPGPESEGLLFACLTKLSPSAQEAATSRLRALFAEQAQEAWATEPRVRAILSLARLELGYGQKQSAFEAEGHLLHAVATLDADEDLPEADRARLLSLHDALYASLPGRASAASKPVKAQAAEPFARPVHISAEPPPSEDVLPRKAHFEQAATVTESSVRTVSDRPYASAAEETASFPPKPHAHVFGERKNGARRRNQTDPGLAPVMFAPPAQTKLTAQQDADAEAKRLEERGRSSLRPVQIPEPHPYVAQVSYGDDQLLASLLEGDHEGLASLLASPPANPSHSDALCAGLLNKVRATGRSNVAVLRALRMLGGHYPALHGVCNEAIVFFDPPSSTVRRVESASHHEASFAEALLAARDDGDFSTAFTLLAHLAQGAAPLFRRTLGSYGISASDFIGRNLEHPYASQAADVAARFGVEHDVYLRHTGEDRMALVPTHPTAILVGDGVATDPLVLRYRFARLFECARPGGSLLATLTPDSARTLLAAVKAAFGPTDSKGPPVARDAASLAAELWRTMPATSQRQVSNLFRVAQSQPSYTELAEHLSLRSARVGLVLTHALDVALNQFGQDWDADARPIGTTAQDLDRALRERPAVQGLVAFALSESYLSLRAALLRQR